MLFYTIQQHTEELNSASVKLNTAHLVC